MELRIFEILIFTKKLKFSLLEKGNKNLQKNGRKMWYLDQYGCDKEKVLFHRWFIFRIDGAMSLYSFGLYKKN